ncbi:tetratricopeptide repeat protein [Stella sp.]|uniref:O-linked N-acetylglucosamine transferase, SPINDLY family protein n=1 Tax=Stella sp. TaxID=2912054 RepID=UPI0035AF8416
MTADAVARCEAWLSQRPDDRPGMAALAEALGAEGRFAEALAWIERAVAGPSPLPAWIGRHGILLARAGRFAEAVARIEAALSSGPDAADLRWELGRALERLGNSERAIREYRRGLELAPDHPGILASLGSALWLRRESAPAMEALRRAVELRPDWVPVRDSLANAHHYIGEWDEAERIFDETLRLRPDDLTSRLNACIARLRVIYADPAERQRSRAAYIRDLHALERLPLPASVDELLRVLGARKPFLLAYQGEVDRDLQAVYGGLLCRAVAARHPEFVRPLPPRPPAPGERIRVGILSAFFRHHSNWKMRLRAWLEDLDRDRFEVHAYFPGEGADAETARARSLADAFVEGSRSVADWARRIRADRLHVLLIPEIGMNSTTMQLAAMRLAPVQASSWGHPQTSGMPTVDDFLSSAMMEPADGEQHYTERLVRLPGLSCRPIPVAKAPERVTRAELGVGPDHVLYWCCQSLYKYLPEHDDVFPRIAARLPAARFLFLGHPDGPKVELAFQQRIGRAFAAFGLDAAVHCRFLGRLSSERFAGCAQASDIFLDSIGWSGCNSTIEGMMFDLPVVTWPGRTMRARHSDAILRLAGIARTIVATREAYVELAARIGADPGLRGELRAEVARGKHRIFEDRSYLPGLEAYLAAAAKGRR